MSRFSSHWPTLGMVLLTLGALGLGACSEHHGHHHEGEHHTHADEAQPVTAAPNGAPAQVQDGVSVSGAWVRATVGEQDATGAYFTLNSEQALTLVGVASPAAEVAEVHEMRMDGDIMRMRKADRLDIKPGEALELKPGGYHVMLMVLNGPIEPGQEIELSLQFEKPDGSTLEMPVKAVAGATAADAGHGSGQHHSH
ncbi:copper chaperone PCu(A)C [Limnobacter sp.]|uniref:copper chaperone PCu(A)C n=1 Tax=Limnobacter sp. TaxID=2003368 RepID=UPI003517F716